MNPKLLKYLEGAGWAAGGAALSVAQASLTAGHFTSGDLRAAGAAALFAIGAYLRVHSVGDTPADAPPVPPAPPKP